VAAGIAADDDGQVVLVALAHTSDDAASANAEALEQTLDSAQDPRTGEPLKALYELDDVDVTDDHVVVARLRGLDPQAHHFGDLLLYASPLVAYC
jgi:hypothetical protein